MSQEIHGLVDHLFRREAGRMVAALTRFMGPARLDLAEEVVQEALIQALKRWPFHGVPGNPRAWLYRVARNLALDRLRRDASFRGKETSIRDVLGPEERDGGQGEVLLEGEVDDDQLRLVFLCCHPELARDARVALTLKTVLGFSVPEIARAFLAPQATIAQRLVRAQKRIRESAIAFEVPPPTELPARLETVLEVLYLAFNEGYGAHEGDALVRTELCEEALRLASHLAALQATDRPVTHALAALLFFQAARLPARIDTEGELVRLEDQDRALWDRALIGRAFRHLESSAAGEEISEYHLQAVIAAEHTAAASDGSTAWERILDLYDQLLERNPSPIVALNRAVAVAKVQGPAAGLAAIATIEDHPAIVGYYLLHATRADFEAALGEREQAAQSYRQALACPASLPERRFLERRLRKVGGVG